MGLRVCLGSFGEEKRALAIPAIEQRFLGRQSHCLVIVPLQQFIFTPCSFLHQFVLSFLYHFFLISQPTMKQKRSAVTQIPFLD
jgi:hypothetical protein